jgi:hypothetical protein
MRSRKMRQSRKMGEENRVPGTISRRVAVCLLLTGPEPSEDSSLASPLALIRRTID